MIQRLVDRFESRFKLAEVHYPATVVTQGASHAYRDMVGVAVKASALVAVGNVGQAVGGFKGK